MILSSVLNWIGKHDKKILTIEEAIAIHLTIASFSQCIRS